MKSTKMNTRVRLDKFEESFVELRPLEEDLDFVGEAVETVEQARKQITAARHVLAKMAKAVDASEAALA